LTTAQISHCIGLDGRRLPIGYRIEEPLIEKPPASRQLEKPDDLLVCNPQSRDKPEIENFTLTVEKGNFSVSITGGIVTDMANRQIEENEHVKILRRSACTYVIVYWGNVTVL
jgi:hypothetical protein